MEVLSKMSGESAKTQSYSSIKTPDMIIIIDDILTSALRDFPNAAQLYVWESSTSRKVTGDIINPLVSKAAIEASPVRVTIPTGAYITTLKTNMNKGITFQKISVLKLANIGETNVVTEQTDYQKCFVVEIVNSSAQGDLDQITFAFRFVSETLTKHIYGQDGIKIGMTVTNFDYSLGEQI
jgi:hypothetical protein